VPSNFGDYAVFAPVHENRGAGLGRLSAKASTSPTLGSSRFNKTPSAVYTSMAPWKVETAIPGSKHPLFNMGIAQLSTRHQQPLILTQIEYSNAASNDHAVSHMNSITSSHKPPTSVSRLSSAVMGNSKTSIDESTQTRGIRKMYALHSRLHCGVWHSTSICFRWLKSLSATE
jgi:hypothetical protein